MFLYFKQFKHVFSIRDTGAAASSLTRHTVSTCSAHPGVSLPPSVQLSDSPAPAAQVANLTDVPVGKGTGHGGSLRAHALLKRNDSHPHLRKDLCDLLSKETGIPSGQLTVAGHQLQELEPGGASRLRVKWRSPAPLHSEESHTYVGTAAAAWPLATDLTPLHNWKALRKPRQDGPPLLCYVPRQPGSSALSRHAAPGPAALEGRQGGQGSSTHRPGQPFVLGDVGDVEWLHSVLDVLGVHVVDSARVSLPVENQG